MSYTVGQAAKATGKSKPTISRAIGTGIISATKNENGSYTIEPAELHRVFPPKQLSSDETRDILRSETPALQVTLQREIELLREMLTSKDAVIDDLRERLDREGEERRKLTAILTDQRAKAPDVMVPPPTSEPIITPPPPADPAPAATSTSSASVPATPARSHAAPVAVKVRPVKKPPAKEAGWFRRMMGGR
jgi:hypothetical protein